MTKKPQGEKAGAKFNREKTHCSKGHEFTKENTDWRLRQERRLNRNGKPYWQRRCRECHRIEMRKPQDEIKRQD